jgi:hypothetical protein
LYSSESEDNEDLSVKAELADEDRARGGVQSGASGSVVAAILLLWWKCYLGLHRYVDDGLNCWFFVCLFAFFVSSLRGGVHHSMAAASAALKWEDIMAVDPAIDLEGPQGPELKIKLFKLADALPAVGTHGWESVKRKTKRGGELLICLV